MKKLVIVDRDGVINEDSSDFIKHPDEWIPIPGRLEAIAALNQQGFTVVIASNQSGLARGYFDESMLAQIHAKMHSVLHALGGTISQVFYCPHGPQDNCHCRKPQPGLLEQIAREYDCSLANVPFVGDSWRDVQTAQAAGAQPILVLTGNGRKTQEKHAADLIKIPVYRDLWAFSQAWLE